MKPILINEYGNNDVVQFTDAARPEPKAGEALVQIQTAGVNSIDWKIRSGAGERIGLKLPIILGGEIAGVVEKVGAAVSDFKAGDQVYGMVKTGGFAEYVAANASDISLKLENIDKNMRRHFRSAD